MYSIPLKIQIPIPSIYLGLSRKQVYQQSNAKIKPKPKQIFPNTSLKRLPLLKNELHLADNPTPKQNRIP